MSRSNRCSPAYSYVSRDLFAAQYGDTLQSDPVAGAEELEM